MLLRQDGCRHQYSNLLACLDCLESGSDSNFCLSEPDIPTDEAVHGRGRFHVRFHLSGCPSLVRRILVWECSLHFLLPKRIGRESKTTLELTPSIEADKLAGNLLQPSLRPLLKVLPLPTPQTGYLRMHPFMDFVPLQFVQVVQRHVKHIPIGIEESNAFLTACTEVENLESIKNPNAMVNVNEVISPLELLELPQS